MFRRLPIAIFLFAFLLLASPNQSFAAEIGDRARASLLAQIERLLVEVERLQALLDARSAPLDASTYAPYQSVFFPLNFESVYLVTDGELHMVEGDRNRDAADEQLFTLFTDIVGEDAIERYVQEWRIFENESTDLGAFVELIAGTDDWVVGVNRENFDGDDLQVVEAYANLFVHEYAHIIFFDTDEREDSFANRFWTVGDYRHVAAVERASARDRFSVLRHYYNNNESRFVGDYATMSVEEDMAESFVAFVREEKPTGTSLRDKKVRFFYEYADFVKMRTELRSRLMELGVL